MKKMKSNLLLVVFFIFGIILIGLVFAADTDSTIKCYKDSDCGINSTSRYCAGDNSCFKVTLYTCFNPGTVDSICSNGGGFGCDSCSNGCSNSNGVCNGGLASLNPITAFINWIKNLFS